MQSDADNAAESVLDLWSLGNAQERTARRDNDAKLRALADQQRSGQSFDPPPQRRLLPLTGRHVCAMSPLPPDRSGSHHPRWSYCRLVDVRKRRSSGHAETLPRQQARPRNTSASRAVPRVAELAHHGGERNCPGSPLAAGSAYEGIAVSAAGSDAQRCTSADGGAASSADFLLPSVTSRSLHVSTSSVLMEAARTARRQHTSSLRRPPKRTVSAGRQAALANVLVQTSDAAGRLDAAAAAGRQVSPAHAADRPEAVGEAPSPPSPGSRSLLQARSAVESVPQQQDSTVSPSAIVSTPDPAVSAATRSQRPMSRIMSSSSIAEGRPPTPKRRWRFAARLRPFGVGLWRPHTDSPRNAESLPRDSSGGHTEDPADAQVQFRTPQ